MAMQMQLAGLVPVASPLPVGNLIDPNYSICVPVPSAGQAASDPAAAIYVPPAPSEEPPLAPGAAAPVPTIPPIPAASSAPKGSPAPPPVPKSSPAASSQSVLSPAQQELAELQRRVREQQEKSLKLMREKAEFQQKIAEEEAQEEQKHEELLEKQEKLLKLRQNNEIKAKRLAMEEEIPLNRGNFEVNQPRNGPTNHFAPSEGGNNNFNNFNAPMNNFGNNYIPNQFPPTPSQGFDSNSNNFNHNFGDNSVVPLPLHNNQFAANNSSIYADSNGPFDGSGFNFAGFDMNGMDINGNFDPNWNFNDNNNNLGNFNSFNHDNNFNNNQENLNNNFDNNGNEWSNNANGYDTNGNYDNNANNFANNSNNTNNFHPPSNQAAPLLNNYQDNSAVLHSEAPKQTYSAGSNSAYSRSDKPFNPYQTPKTNPIAAANTNYIGRASNMYDNTKDFDKSADNTVHFPVQLAKPSPAPQSYNAPQAAPAFDQPSYSAQANYANEANISGHADNNFNNFNNFSSFDNSTNNPQQNNFNHDSANNQQGFGNIDNNFNHSGHNFPSSNDNFNNVDSGFNQNHNDFAQPEPQFIPQPNNFDQVIHNQNAILSHLHNQSSSGEIYSDNTTIGDEIFTNPNLSSYVDPYANDPNRFNADKPAEDSEALLPIASHQASHQGFNNNDDRSYNNYDNPNNSNSQFDYNNSNNSNIGNNFNNHNSDNNLAMQQNQFNNNDFDSSNAQFYPNTAQDQMNHNNNMGFPRSSLNSLHNFQLDSGEGQQRASSLIPNNAYAPVSATNQPNLDPANSYHDSGNNLAAQPHPSQSHNSNQLHSNNGSSSRYVDQRSSINNFNPNAANDQLLFDDNSEGIQRPPASLPSLPEIRDSKLINSHMVALPSLPAAPVHNNSVVQMPQMTPQKAAEDLSRSRMSANLRAGMARLKPTTPKAASSPLEAAAEESEGGGISGAFAGARKKMQADLHARSGAKMNLSLPNLPALPDPSNEGDVEAANKAYLNDQEGGNSNNNSNAANNLAQYSGSYAAKDFNLDVDDDFDD
jgi:hypothetical protein